MLLNGKQNLLEYIDNLAFSNSINKVYISSILDKVSESEHIFRNKSDFYNIVKQS